MNNSFVPETTAAELPKKKRKKPLTSSSSCNNSLIRVIRINYYFVNFGFVTFFGFLSDVVVRAVIMQMRIRCFLFLLMEIACEVKAQWCRRLGGTDKKIRKKLYKSERKRYCIIIISHSSTVLPTCLVKFNIIYSHNVFRNGFVFGQLR